MSIETWTIVGIAGLALMAAGTAVVLAIRNSGLKGVAAKLEVSLASEKAEAQRLEKQLGRVASELVSAREVHRRQIEIRDADLEQLYEDLAQCSSPDAVRDRLNRLFGGEE